MTLTIDDYVAGITEKGGEDKYFTELSIATNENLDELRKYEDVIRKAMSYVLNFYKDLEFKPTMTLEELDGLGEGVQVTELLDPEKRELISVNIGMGGNGHSFYFDKKTGTPIPLEVIDATDAYKLAD